MSSYVLALQHSPAEPLGIIGDVFRSVGLGAQPVRGFADEPVPQDVGSASGLIVLGGPMGAYEQERYPFLADEMRLIERALENKLPVLGICLGGQLLAHVLGADVRKAPQLEIGWHTVIFTEAAAGDAVFQDFPPGFIGFHWHGDIFGLPRDAVPLAFSDMTPCQAFRYADATYGIQFHMEVTESIIQNWAVDGVEELSKAGLTAEPILSGISHYLPAQQQLGRKTFSHWANRTLSTTEVLEAL